MSQDQEDIVVRFCVPSIGAKLVLANSWTFTLYDEYRNSSLISAMGKDSQRSYGSADSLGPVTLEAGTKLTVDRIYIRRGISSFDSLTFRIAESADPRFKKKGIRFWAKLKDVNKIECFPVGTDPKSKETFDSYVDESHRFMEI